MADEIKCSFALTCNKATAMGAPVGKSFVASLTQTGKGYSQGSVSAVATGSGTSVPLGDTTVGAVGPHWSYFANLDASIAVNILDGAQSGNPTIGYLGPGEADWFALNTACQPKVKAASGTVEVEFLLLGA